jgi:hypothetical protein
MHLPLAKEIKTTRSFQSAKPNCFFRGAVDRGCIGSGLRTIERLPPLLRKFGQQVRPVPSDNATYSVVYNIEAVEGLNLTADDFKFVRAEAATVKEFHWHGGQCASQEDRSTNSYSRTSSLTRAKKPALNAVSAKLSQMAKKGESGHRGKGKGKSHPGSIEATPVHNPTKMGCHRQPFLGDQRLNYRA